MTKYRTKVDNEEVIVITEDGGVACIREVDADDHECYDVAMKDTEERLKRTRR